MRNREGLKSGKPGSGRWALQLVLHAVRLGIVIISQRPHLILSPLRALFFLGLPVLDVSVGQRLLPISGDQGTSQALGGVGDVRGCSRGAGGPELGVRGPGCCCGGVEGMWGKLGGYSGCESGTPLGGRARFQSNLCPKTLLWHNFFWPFAWPEGSLMHQWIFLNRLI